MQLANPTGLSNHDRKSLAKRKHRVSSVEIGSFEAFVELLQDVSSMSVYVCVYVCKCSYLLLVLIA